MEQKIDLTGLDPQTLDPKQAKELFAAAEAGMRIWKMQSLISRSAHGCR